MKPNDPQDNRRVGAPYIPERSSQPPERARPDASQAAAVTVARGQLERIYDGETTTPTPQTTPVEPHRSTPSQATPAQEVSHSPYERTHSTHVSASAEQWQQYHSAWQQYYQKYYERYYMGEIHKTRRQLEERASEATAQQPQPRETPPALETNDGVSRDEAMYDLRQRLLGNVRSSAQKVRKSRHFIPITAAVCVVLVFLFLQYNRVLFANVQAYISPGNAEPVNIIVDPTAKIDVGPDPKLIIPKINVDVPVVYDTTPDQTSQLAAMEKGVAWFGIPGANSKPGQVGNTVLSGHSSNDVIDQGDYKFIFARLDTLDTGDLIYINYKSVRYTYSVTKKEVVKPTQVNALIYDTKKPVLTLITCTPLGTALNRLLVTAEQISPSPNTAASAPSVSETKTEDMPGNSPTFLERLFGQ